MLIMLDYIVKTPKDLDGGHACELPNCMNKLEV